MRLPHAQRGKPHVVIVRLLPTLRDMSECNQIAQLRKNSCLRHGKSPPVRATAATVDIVAEHSVLTRSEFAASLSPSTRVSLAVNDASQELHSTRVAACIHSREASSLALDQANSDAL